MSVGDTVVGITTSAGRVPTLKLHHVLRGLPLVTLGTPRVSGPLVTFSSLTLRYATPSLVYVPTPGLGTQPEGTELLTYRRLPL